MDLTGIDLDTTTVLAAAGLVLAAYQPVEKTIFL